MTVSAAGIDLKEFSFTPGGEGYDLSVNAELELSPAVVTLLERGVTLTFRAEAEIHRPRWYWLNERVVRKVQNHQLSYQSLTRQYRVTTGDLQQNYPTLREALGKLSRLRFRPLLERRDVKLGAQHEAAFRFYLDVSQLPKPLQVSAFLGNEWVLSAEPRLWTFVGDTR